MGGLTMGGQRAYIPSGGFKEYLYHQIGDTITANGLSGKVISKIGGSFGHDGLPHYSNTSKIYFKLDKNGKVEQARIYNKRIPSLDIDWGHPHHEFPQGIVHVHEYYKDNHGNWHRDEINVRFMNNAEIKKYGELLKKANPNIKFR